MTKGYVPPGWPADVLPVDVEGWEQTAVDWLLDYGDPAWRYEPTWQRHPAALVHLARLRAEADVEAARAVWRVVAELGLPPDAEAGARNALARVGPVLAARLVAVDLVATALVGGRWTPRL